MKPAAFAAIGLAAFAGWGAVLVPLLASAARQERLTARLAPYPETAADGRPRLGLRPAPSDAIAAVDGRPGDLAAPLSPGLHALGYLIERSTRRSEQVHAAVLVGPFAQDGWAHCAAQVTVTQHMLDQRLAPLASQLVRQAVAQVDELPAVEHVDTRLELTARGFKVGLALRFVDHSELTIASELAIAGDGRGVRVARGGAVQAHIKGPMVDEALDAYVPDMVKRVPYALTLLHKITGGAVRWYAQRVAREKASDAVDLELVPAAMQLLQLPAEVPLPGLPGSHVELRFCGRGITAVAHSHVTAAFDLRVATAGTGPGFVLVRGRPVAPPPGPPPDAELVVDLSIDGLNAVLDGLARAGALDRALADRGLRAAVDDALEPLVFRARELSAALPPVVSELASTPHGARLTIGAELALRLQPRAHPSAPGQAARLRVQSDLVVAVSAPPGRELTLDAAPRMLGLTCRRPDPDRPGGLVLAACYADLVSMIAMSFDAPEAAALDSLRIPLDPLLPRETPDGRVRFTLERLDLTAAGPDWLRLDARTAFTVAR